jgi:amino acid permease
MMMMVVVMVVVMMTMMIKMMMLMMIIKITHIPLSRIVNRYIDIYIYIYMYVCMYIYIHKSIHINDLPSYPVKQSHSPEFLLHIPLFEHSTQGCKLSALTTYSNKIN